MNSVIRYGPLPSGGVWVVLVLSRLAPVVLGKNRDLAEARHHGGVQAVPAVQMERQIVVAVDFHRVHHAESRLQVKRGVLGNVFEREAHVPGRHGDAVMPTGLVPQPNANPAEVVGDHHALGEVAVEGPDLVVRRREQAVVEERIRPEVVLYTRRHHALVQIRRERVPRCIRRQHHHAALGRVWIHIVEVLEIGAVLEIAEERHAVLERRLGGGQRDRAGDGQQERRCRRLCPHPLPLQRGRSQRDATRASPTNNRRSGSGPRVRDRPGRPPCPSATTRRSPA